MNDCRFIFLSFSTVFHHFSSLESVARRRNCNCARITLFLNSVFFFLFGLSTSYLREQIRVVGHFYALLRVFSLRRNVSLLCCLSVLSAPHERNDNKQSKGSANIFFVMQQTKFKTKFVNFRINVKLT
jgi:NhaP-type Na+/H+ or K+/H+ antiporter